MGKKSSLNQLKNYLQNIRYIHTEFGQGKTMRWAIAWTFDNTYQFPEQCQSQKNWARIDGLTLDQMMWIGWTV